MFLRNLLTTASRNPFALTIEPEGADEGAGGGAGDAPTGRDVEQVQETLYNDDTDKDGADEGKDAPEAKEGAEGDDTKPDEASGGEDAAKDEGKAEDDAKTEDEPEVYTADNYDLTIPEDLGLKDEKGDPFQFADGDPLVEEFKAMAVEDQLKPETAQKMVALYAKAVKDTRDTLMAEGQAAQDAHAQAELAKLEIKGEGGKVTTGPQRIQALEAKIGDVLGDGAYKKLAPGLINAEIVETVEALLEQASDGGVGTGGRGGSGQPDPLATLYPNDVKKKR